MEPKSMTAGDVAELKKRLVDGRNQVVAQQARADQLQMQLAESRQQITKTYGMSPEQLAAELVKAEAEIQVLGNQILAQLAQAGL